ncbi:MAG TPA: DinB family protein [Terriglobia bacterium]|nr:DinB family protein [Terriglobia bacterium]
MTPSTRTIGPPESSEYAPHYGRYISLVKRDDVISALAEQGEETVAQLSGLTEKQAEHRYAPGKWSVKEMIGHVIDTERIMAFRALCIAREERQPLPGFEQDDYVRAACFGNRMLAGLIEEFAAVRRATVLLLEGFDAEAWRRRGVANQKEVSVRALAYVIAGHELHHRTVLQEKYLTAAASA